MFRPSGFTLFGLLALALTVAVTPSPEAAPPDSPPIAPKRPVTDVYWGVEIVDDYRYLENTQDPEVLDWAKKENAYARRVLDAAPHRDAIGRRLRELLRHESDRYSLLQEKGGRLFAKKEEPPKEQPFLVEISSFRDRVEERVLVDPNGIDPSGGTSIDFYSPSNDGRLLAVSLSAHGTEDGTVHVWNVDTGEKLGDEIARVNGGTAGGAVAWTAANDGFFYTRYPHPGERPAEDLSFYQQIWFHRLGDDLAKDRYVLGETFPRIAEIGLKTSDDGRWIVAEVSNGDGGEYEFWLHGPKDQWKKFAEFEDGVQSVEFGADGNLYLLSRKDAPKKKILRVPTRNPDLAGAEVIAAEGEGVIQSFAAGVTRLWVTELLGGPSRLRVLEHDGGREHFVDLGEISTVSLPTRLAGDRLLFRRETFLEPAAWFELPPGALAPEPTAMVSTSAADWSDCEATRIFAPAEDGTPIPINVVKQETTPIDGTAPLLLYGYGSYGISMRPYFSASRRVWVEQGGIYAVANIRGGGEYGDEWHRVANLENKKTSMDDFAACARHLVEAGYTTRDRLAIEGGSAGGLMVYGTMAYYPDRMAAVVSRVGPSDALRAEFHPNGEFNITEFGTVKNEKQFPGMLAASPYHQVRDGVTYPAVLSLTGMNDPRVVAWQPFKMTARLQAAGSPNPVLLRVSVDTGHGGGTSLTDQEAELLDVYSFLFERLGVEYTPVDEPGGTR